MPWMASRMVESDGAIRTKCVLGTGCEPGLSDSLAGEWLHGLMSRLEGWDGGRMELVGYTLGGI